MGGTNTGSTVFNGFVGNGEFSEIMTNHFWLDFDLIEGFAVVNADDGSGHFRDDDHISQMSFNDVGFFVGQTFLLLLSEFLDQSHRLPFQTPSELSPDSAREQFHQLFIVLIQQLIQIHASVREFSEGSLLSQFSGSLKINKN